MNMVLVVDQEWSEHWVVCSNYKDEEVRRIINEELKKYKGE